MKKPNRKQYAQDRLTFDVTENILIAMEDGQISPETLARKIGKSRSFVKQRLKGNGNLSLRMLATICFEIDADIQITIKSKS